MREQRELGELIAPVAGGSQLPRSKVTPNLVYNTEQYVWAILPVDTNKRTTKRCQSLFLTAVGNFSKVQIAFDPELSFQFINGLGHM